MKTIYNKLVRDNIPEIINNSGRTANYFTIDNDADYKRALKAKLIEEANELLSAQTEDEIVEELADIVTLLAVLLQEHNVNNHIDTERVLMSKLVEEANQLYIADTEEEVARELSDIMTILSCLLATHERTVATVRIKLAEKGGFSKRYFLESVEE